MAAQLQTLRTAHADLEAQRARHGVEQAAAEARLHDAHAVWARVHAPGEGLCADLAAAEEQLAELLQDVRDGKAGREESGGAVTGARAIRQSAEEAMAALHASSSRGQLDGGAFYGRVQGVLRLKEEGAGAAVNAVLMETCNLVRMCVCLVVGRGCPAVQL
jgi:hypothetical protein